MRRGWALLALAAGCSGISDNADGIASLELTLPVNLYLEKGVPLQLKAVARNAAGDSVGVPLVWRSSDTTITVDSVRGTVTPLRDAGTARIQVAAFGQDTLVTRYDALVFTLTPKADTLILTGPDSLNATVDSIGTAPIGVRLMGGAPLIGVGGRPVTFRIVEPVQSDSPNVVLSTGGFASNRIVDSVLTAGTGAPAAGPAVRAARGRTAPDRAVVEINAYRASGALIPGSRRLVVVRFLHQ